MDQSATKMGPFAIVPRWLHRSGISDGALRLYVALADRADRDEAKAKFSRRTLADDMGISDLATVSKRIAELEEIGAIEVTRAKGPRGSEINLYEVVQVRPSRQTPTDPVGKPLSTPVGKRLREEEPVLEEPTTTDADPFASLIAEQLASHVSQRPGGPKRIDTDRWAVTIEQMLRLDQIEPEALVDFIEWLFTAPSSTAEFWRCNVRSAAKLREKYGQILDQRQREDQQQQRRTEAQRPVQAITTRAEDSQHPNLVTRTKLPAHFWNDLTDKQELIDWAAGMGLTWEQACAIGGRDPETLQQVA